MIEMIVINSIEEAKELNGLILVELKRLKHPIVAPVYSVIYKDNNSDRYALNYCEKMFIQQAISQAIKILGYGIIENVNLEQWELL